MIPDPPPADVLAPRLAHNLWGTRGTRTYAHIGWMGHGGGVGCTVTPLENEDKT